MMSHHVTCKTDRSVQGSKAELMAIGVRGHDSICAYLGDAAGAAVSRKERKLSSLVIRSPYQSQVTLFSLERDPLKQERYAKKGVKRDNTGQLMYS